MEEVPYVQRRLPAAGTTSGSAAHGGDTLHAALFHPIAGDSLAATAAAPRVVPCWPCKVCTSGCWTLALSRSLRL